MLFKAHQQMAKLAYKKHHQYKLQVLITTSSSKVFALVDDENNHHQCKQPIAVSTKAETLIRTYTCATCIWLLHPTPTSVVGRVILVLNECKHKCDANILPPALPFFSLESAPTNSSSLGALSNSVNSGMTVLLSATYTLNSLSTLSKLWKCSCHLASTFDGPCVSSPLSFKTALGLVGCGRWHVLVVTF